MPRSGHATAHGSRVGARDASRPGLLQRPRSEGPRIGVWNSDRVRVLPGGNARGLHEMVYAGCVKRRRSPLLAVNLIALRDEELRQARSILPGNPRDQCFRHDTHDINFSSPHVAAKCNCYQGVFLSPARWARGKADRPGLTSGQDGPCPHNRERLDRLIGDTHSAP
jgi:hypothetical protein